MVNAPVLKILHVFLPSEMYYWPIFISQTHLLSLNMQFKIYEFFLDFPFNISRPQLTKTVEHKTSEKGRLLYNYTWVQSRERKHTNYLKNLIKKGDY